MKQPLSFTNRRRFLKTGGALAAGLLSWEGVATRPGTMNIRDAMRYVLSLPVSTVIVGCDNIAQLEENVQIAREFTPLSQAQMAALGNQVAPVARQALFFHFETRPRDIDSLHSG
jgi:uncharacterized protein